MLFLQKGTLYFALLFSSSSLVLAFLAPILEYHRIQAAQWLYAYLRLSCHQIPSRSLWVLGSNTGLCARCIGIYASLSLSLIMLLALLDSRAPLKDRKLLFCGLLMLLPMLVDGLTQILSSHPSNTALRMITGALFGMGLSFILFFIRRRVENEGN